MDKLDERYFTHMAAAMGTRQHALAEEAIRMGVKLAPESGTIAMYVNDAIDMEMTPEVTLYYSDNCFGHADAISFDGSHLQIHDLKTGASKVSVSQLMIYAALFCLEYGHRPFDISIELRIYQLDEVQVYDRVDPGEIAQIMDTIIQMDKRLELLQAQSS